MMSEAKKMVPKRRFKEFLNAGDWEQRKLGDFTNQINTFVNPEDAKLPLWSLTAEAGLIEKSDRYERDFLVKKKDQFKRIETNTLVYNPMNITIGSIDIYTGLYPIAVSGYYVSIVYDKNIDTDFLKEVLLLPSSLKMYKNYATGSLIERQRVQYPTFSKLQLLLPNLDEQKAIGQFFKLLNLNITLHQRKLDKLQATKKALLQEMFPEEGQDKPKRRFKGFTDAWEQRKLGDIATFSKGNGYSKSDLTPSGDPIILYGRLYTNYETTISNVDTFAELKDKSVISQGGEVIVPASGETAEDISRASVVKNEGIIIGGDLNVIKVNHLLDPTFLALTISNGEQQKELSKRAQGKSVVHLHNSDLQEVNLIFPLLNEQKKISTLFEKMDNIITLHQRKLDKLKNLKQAYLNEIFV